MTVTKPFVFAVGAMGARCREVHAGFCEQPRGQFPRLTHPRDSFGSTLDNQFFRHHSYYQHDAHRDDEQGIQIAQHRNEVGNEINWTERVPCNYECDSLNMPQSTWITVSDIDRHHIGLQLTRP